MKNLHFNLKIGRGRKLWNISNNIEVDLNEEVKR